MAHPDHETRVGAHSIFSIVLMPSLLSPWSDQNKKTSEAVSCDLSVSASKKVRSHSFAFLDEDKDQSELIDGRLKENGNQASDTAVKDSYSFKHAPGDEKMV